MQRGLLQLARSCVDSKTRAMHAELALEVVMKRALATWATAARAEAPGDEPHPQPRAPRPRRAFWALHTGAVQRLSLGGGPYSLVSVLSPSNCKAAAIEVEGKVSCRNSRYVFSAHVRVDVRKHAPNLELRPFSAQST